MFTRNKCHLCGYKTFSNKKYVNHLLDEVKKRKGRGESPKAPMVALPDEKEA